MAGPLLYRPPPRWQFWTALGGALAIHLGSVVIAGIKHEPPAVDLSQIPTATVEAMLQPEDQPTPPPEDIPIQEPPPPQTNRPAGPITAPQGVTGTMSISGAKAVAIFAPKPDYPYEARSHHITGSGVADVDVDSATGSVINVTMGASTGNSMLDNAALAAFRRWQFQPGTPVKVKIPITFTIAGAEF